MPQTTVTGSFSIEASSNFTAAFTIGNLKYSFSARLGPGPSDKYTFVVEDAVLTYNSVDELTPAHSSSYWPALASTLTSTMAPGSLEISLKSLSCRSLSLGLGSGFQRKS